MAKPNKRKWDYEKNKYLLFEFHSSDTDSATRIINATINTETYFCLAACPVFRWGQICFSVLRCLQIGHLADRQTVHVMNQPEFSVVKKILSLLWIFSFAAVICLKNYPYFLSEYFIPYDAVDWRKVEGITKHSSLRPHSNIRIVKERLTTVNHCKRSGLLWLHTLAHTISGRSFNCSIDISLHLLWGLVKAFICFRSS